MLVDHFSKIKTELTTVRYRDKRKWCEQAILNRPKWTKHALKVCTGQLEDLVHEITGELDRMQHFVSEEVHHCR